MQDSRINYVVVGAFVSAMLVVFVIVIAMLAGRTGAADDYYTVYNNVSGVKFGTLVFYEGYQIGQVDSVEPVNRNGQLSFKVNLSVEKGWQIPEGSVARANVSGLLSAIAIDIQRGKGPAALKPGSEIPGVSASNFFAALSDIGAQFSELSASSIKPLLDNLNIYVQRLGDTTADHLPGILMNLEALSASLAKDTPEITGSLRRTLALVETDVLKPENRDKIDAILANLESVSGGLQQTQLLLNESMQRVNQVVQDNAGNVDESVRDLRYTLDTISRYVDDVAHNTDATLRNLAEFSREIRENPGVFISGSAPADQAKEGAK